MSSILFPQPQQINVSDFAQVRKHYAESKPGSISSGRTSRRYRRQSRRSRRCKGYGAAKDSPNENLVLPQDELEEETRTANFYTVCSRPSICCERSVTKRRSAPLMTATTGIVTVALRLSRRCGPCHRPCQQRSIHSSSWSWLCSGPEKVFRRRQSTLRSRG